MAKLKARRTVKAKAKKKAPKMAARRRAKPAPRARKAKAARKRSAQAPRLRSRQAKKAKVAGKARRLRAAPASRLRTAKPAPRKRVAAKSTRPRPPALQRERRRLTEGPLTASVPSSLDFDRSASSAKSGRNAMLHHRREHTETGPALTGGDIDADWEDGYSEGDEAPGGDNPTPDQDVVEEIGRALGVEYEDSEELKGADKITERDTNRWEYDPASAEDYRDRNKKQ